MTMPPIRVYVDTSVFGGVFDVEFEEASREFFAQVVEGRFRLVASAVVDREIRPLRYRYKFCLQRCYRWQTSYPSPQKQKDWSGRISRPAPLLPTHRRMRFMWRRRLSTAVSWS